MAELSFGHNLRAKRKEVVNNTLTFLPWAQGCLTACAPANAPSSIDAAAPANTIHFHNAPAKMLGVALHEYGSPHQFKVQLCNLPRELRDGELLVQVQAAGVNPTDCKLRSGALQQLYPLSLPSILGCDFAGVVTKERNTAFSVGDTVFGRQTLDRLREVHGTYAEFVVVDAREVTKKPDDVSFEEAAAVPWAGLTAFAALVHVGGLTYKNDTGGRRAVLVLGGSGGVGTFAVQLAKHYLRCHTVASCSRSNAELVKKLGADEVLDYSEEGFLRSAKRPDLGQGNSGFSVVLDCVGGDDYWEMAQGLLAEGGCYVTLVGPQRYGGEAGQVSVGSAMQMQMQTGIRNGLGMLGASKRYTVFTPSMSQGSDLDTLARLLAEGKLQPVVKKVWSMYDVIDAHELLETHRCVGKSVVQVRKGLPEEGGDSEGTEPDDDADSQVDLSKMVLDKRSMKLVPKGQLKKRHATGGGGGGGEDEEDEEEDLGALRQKQLAVAQRLRALKHAKGDDGAGRPDGAEDGDLEWLQENGAASAMLGLEAELEHGGRKNKNKAGTRGKRSVQWGDDDIKELGSDGDGDGDDDGTGAGRGGGRAQEWEDDEPEGSGGAYGGKTPLSKKEQYRLAVEKAKTQQLQTERVGVVPAEEMNDTTFKTIQEAKMRGLDLGDELHRKKENVLVTQGAITHAGVLRKKKEDHGRFEDPYKTVCLANLDDGVLSLRLTHNGEVVGLQEDFDLGDGWKLLVREDKKDRFTLIRTGPKMESDEIAQVSLKCESKAEGEVWVEKLKQTALWFNDRQRKASGVRSGAGQSKAAPPRSDDPIRLAPTQSSLNAATKNTAGKDQCGVGMVLKQTAEGLLVKKLVDGAPAALSGSIELGDILLKVDTKKVATAEEAAKAILGDQGTPLHLQMQREWEGKTIKFPVKLVRDKPK